MKFYKDKEVVSVEVFYGCVSTHKWQERVWWGTKEITEEIVRSPKLILVFADGTNDVLECDTNEEAKNIALKIKEKYGLINLKEL